MSTASTRKAEDLALVRIKDRAQITLPPEVRKALNVGVGDYLETEVVDGGVLLRPVAVVERTKELDALFQVIEQVRHTGSLPRPAPEEEERMVADAVRAYRKAQRAKERT